MILPPSPLATLRSEERIYDSTHHVHFDRRSLTAKRLFFFFNYLKFLDIPFNLSDILNSNSEPVIALIVFFVLEAGFLIFNVSTVVFFFLIVVDCNIVKLNSSY